MTPANIAGQFGDTTYTKVFVGGLAWETQKDTMKNYFEQFGEILEAVVITDKATGRSKGYGFVTFREPEAAMRACVDPAPVIDGRRANCNLASLGVQRSKPSTPKHGGGVRNNNNNNFRVMSSFQTSSGFGGVANAFPSAAAAATFPYHAIQQGIPYTNLYGYSPYSPDYAYPTSYYGMYGGATAQYPMYGTGPATGGMMTNAAAYYPYLQLGEGNGATTYGSGQGYGMQYPQQMFQYSAINSNGAYAHQHYGAPMSLAPASALQSGLNIALHAAPIAHH
ncbi:hypothetical protein ACFE04_025485 [Oxalis oulophora]